MNNNQNHNSTEVICYCTGTTKAQIAALMNNGINTVAEIANQTGAGTGCGGCDYLIEELLAKKASLLSKTL